MAQEAPARTKIPTTSGRRGRTARQAGEGWPHGTRQGPRERDRTRGHPGRFAAPVIDAVACQDITTGHMQEIGNAAP